MYLNVAHFHHLPSNNKCFLCGIQFKRLQWVHWSMWTLPQAFNSWISFSLFEIIIISACFLCNLPLQCLCFYILLHSEGRIRAPDAHICHSTCQSNLGPCNVYSVGYFNSCSLFLKTYIHVNKVLSQFLFFIMVILAFYFLLFFSVFFSWHGCSIKQNIFIICFFWVIIVLSFHDNYWKGFVL